MFISKRERHEFGSPPDDEIDEILDSLDMILPVRMVQHGTQITATVGGDQCCGGFDSNYGSGCTSTWYINDCGLTITSAGPNTCNGFGTGYPSASASSSKKMKAAKWRDIEDAEMSCGWDEQGRGITQTCGATSPANR